MDPVAKEYFADATESSLTFYSIPVCPGCGPPDARCASRKVIDLVVNDIPPIEEMIEVPKNGRRK
jgi:hypothetical protein